MKSLKKKKFNKLSYHDVVVFVNDKKYEIFNNYGIELTCTRVCGWSLWNVMDGKYTLIGEEYGNDDFRIEIGGNVICGKKPGHLLDRSKR